MTELQRHDVPEEPKDQGLQPAVKMPGVCHVRHCSGDDKRLESQLAVFLDYSRVPVGASWKTSVTGRLPKGRKPWNKAKNSWPRLSCVEQNLVPVDPGVIEAARSMGASKPTIVRTVLIPEALAPLILAYAFLFIGVLDMSAMAGYIGGGGLGNFAIAYGYQKFDQTVTWTAVIIMIVLVQVVQGIANSIARHLLKR